MAPSAISVATGSILTRPTLQLLGHSHLFALGDVAETEGPKMARAALSQAEVVCWNICLLIKGKGELAKYKPDPVERALKLSVGVVSASNRGLTSALICFFLRLPGTMGFVPKGQSRQRAPARRARQVGGYGRQTCLENVRCRCRVRQVWSIRPILVLYLMEIIACRGCYQGPSPAYNLLYSM